MTSFSIQAVETRVEKYYIAIDCRYTPAIIFWVGKQVLATGQALKIVFRILIILILKLNRNIESISVLIHIVKLWLCNILSLVESEYEKIAKF